MSKKKNAQAYRRDLTVQPEETETVSCSASSVAARDAGRDEYRVLDLLRVCEMAAGFCRTPMGRERARAMRPKADRQWVSDEYDRVDELLALDAELPLEGIYDIRDVLFRARREAGLVGAELLAVSRTCAGMRECRRFLSRRKERAPRVWELARALGEHPELEKAVEGALDDKGEVRDSATPALAEVRRELRSRRNHLVERLEATAAEHPEWYSDRPTVRRERFVLAVRVEARDRLPGVVHDTSDSGRTLFVEPMETMAEQNRLAELRGAEAEETARVLRTLSEMTARVSDELSAGVDVAGELDLLAAKRRFALDLDCARPELSEDGRIVIVAGRHPLLARRKADVVPLEFRVPDEKTVVLVSGPNAGGKTVVIKTLGLLCLMTSCGMPLSAAAGTRLPLFDRVFADIGDEQSLDADLSSFTAHVTRLKVILEQANPGSLALLDEIGSSTAPEEGAALAVAALETLRDRSVTTVATSHFGALKMFVQNEPGMVNAAMGFSQGRPTYRLTFGFPGESSALEIAARAGLSRELLKRAESRLGREWLDMGEKLRALDAELEAARRARSEAETELREGKRLRDEYLGGKKELEQRTATERENLRQEREEMLTRTRREIENLVREIRESQAGRAAVVKAKRFVEEQLESSRSQTGIRGSQDSSPVAQGTLEVGDIVESRSYRKRGTVAEVKEGSVTVTFGSIRMRLKQEDLVLAPGPEQGSADGVSKGQPAIADEPGFEPKLNVIGMTGEEADDAVGRFLDEARYWGAGEVSIVHGRGTGVLQRVVRTRLRRDPGVQEFRHGEPYEGGDGVTFVSMKAEGRSRKSEGRAGGKDECGDARGGS